MSMAVALKPVLESVYDMVRAYLRVDELIVTDHGEIPVRVGSAIIYIRLADSEPSVLRVYSPVLSHVPPTDELFRRLNEINAEICFGRLFWLGETVVAALELVAETLDVPELANACQTIGQLADRFDDELQAGFGGRRRFDL